MAQLYIVQVPSSKPCFLADWEGDPGRTLIRTAACQFTSKRQAEEYIERVLDENPHRNWKLSDLKIIDYKPPYAALIK